MRTLYEHAGILLVEETGTRYIKDGFLGVEDDVFCFVGAERPQEEYDIRKDMTGKVIMPGLYNCHTHAPMVLLRGVGSDLPLEKWLFDCVVPIEDKLTADLITTGSELAVLEMIAGGTVSFSDMYFFPERTADAVIAAGMKANISRPVQDFSFDPPERAEKRIRESLTLYDAYHGAGDGRVLIDFSIHAEYTCSSATAQRFAGMCNARGGNMHIHLSETVKEHEECKQRYGKTPARWFADLGAFESRAFAAHCVALEPEDAALLREKGVSVVNNPTSNMKLGSGFAPIPTLIESGLNVCIGTDGAASNNNLDMFEEMHLAGVVYNGFLRDATVMKADTVLRCATLNGAKLQGRTDSGRIACGYKADFIAIDVDRPHLTPQTDIPALLVYAAGASDVCLTVCNGRILYENGDFKTIDRERVMYDVKNAVKILYS